MLNNQTRRQILSEARQTGFQGSVLDLFQLAEQGADVSSMLQSEAQAKQQQQQMQVAQTAKEQEVGLREEHARGNTGASMAFPNVAPNQAFNTEGMKVPINISKVDEQGHLVQSFNNVPPGIKNLPTGPKRGTVIETPAYKNGGYKGYKQKYQNAGFKYPTNEQGLVTYDGDMRSFTLDQRKDSYINKQLATGKFGYDPTTGSLVKLTPKKQVEVSAEDQKIVSDGIAEQEKSATNILNSEGQTISQEDQYGLDFNLEPGKHQMFNFNTLGGVTIKPEYKSLALDYISGKNKGKLAQSAYIQMGTDQGFDAFSTVAASALPAGNIGKISKVANTNVIKPTANMLLSPLKRYGKNVADDLINITSKSPVGQSLFQTAKSKLGSALSATYNTTKAMALPATYKAIADQGITELQGEGTTKNRIGAVTKLTDVVPALSVIKDSSKIGKDLYNKDYDSAALRTVGVLGKKNPIVKFTSKLINKFTNTDILGGSEIGNIFDDVKSMKPLVLNSLKSPYKTLLQKPVVQAKPASLPTASKYGGYRKRYK